MMRPGFPILTERLRLRPFRDEDLEVLHEMHGREDVMRYTLSGALPKPKTAELLARIKPMTALDGRHGALRLAALLRDGEVLVGDFGCWRTSDTHRQGEIGFIVHPDHQGRGYGLEGAEVLLRLGFETGLHRIEGRCDVRNIGSARLMERLGMRREAHFRENELTRGEWTDELVYAMLASEWTATRRSAMPAG